MQCCTPSCSCSNGINATGAACTSHNANICMSCNDNYSLTGQSCSKICTTTDGSIENSNDCACGTTKCMAATGRKCVASLNVCTSGFVPGDVTLSGSTLRPGLMGKYMWLGSTLNGKPTYKYSTNFLYWYSDRERWQIGPTLGSASLHIHWTDDVLRPELSPKPTTINVWANNKWNFETLTITSSKACVVATGLSINDGECTCGTTDCDASTGFFCVASSNACSTNPICNAIDGSTENSIDCSCGTTVCTVSTGRFCFAYGNKCSTNAIQVCTTIDGSEANINDCACGTTDCTAATGRKCVASLNVCTSGFVPGDVTLAGSTVFPNFMGKYTWLGLNLNGKPTYKYNNFFLYWHSVYKKWFIGGTLGSASVSIYWTDDVLRPELSPKPTAIKAYSNGAFTDDTITITSSKACVVANGESINDGECTCGTTDCDASTGFFCVALLNSCTATYFVPGDLTLTLSGSTTNHSDKMRTYLWVAPFYRNGKPIYRYSSNYLYFLTDATEPNKYPGRWMLGPTLGSTWCYYYWIENVARPELSLFGTAQSKVKVSNTESYQSYKLNTFKDVSISIKSSKSCLASSNGVSANVVQCTCVSFECIIKI